MAASDLFDLGDKVAIVTGASRGIGAEIARLLAAHVLTSSSPAASRPLARAWSVHMGIKQ